MMPQKHLVALALVGLVDAFSYMIVSPSLSFYVFQNGGSKDQYGIILSAFSFSSFCGKPIYGRWTDASGKYRTPYFASIFLAILGGLVYFAGSIIGPARPNVAVAAILTGRLLGGFGAANQALGFAYLATVTPPEKQTQTNTLLSMTRIFGMAAGPGFNALLDKVNFNIGSVTIDPLNCVGLLLAILNSIALVTLYLLLEEPPEKKKKVHSSGEKTPEESVWNTFKASLQVSILLPMIIIFVVNSGFQLIETGLAPAADHGLGWGPVETSTVLGGTSVVICGVMFLVFYLSSHGVADHFLIGVGLVLYAIGGTLMYNLWTVGAPVWHYVLPVTTTVAGFPFIGSSNRSMFTRAVESIPELQNSTAFMQAVLSMIASLAGFVTPSLVASFVLRDPEVVDASTDGRELTVLAWYVPVMSLAALAGLVYVRMTFDFDDLADSSDEDNEGVISEQTSLLRRVSIATGVTNRRRSSACPDNLPKEVLDDLLDPQMDPYRVKCCELMGINMIDSKQDIERRISLSQQHENAYQDWDKIIEEGET